MKMYQLTHELYWMKTTKFILRCHRLAPSHGDRSTGDSLQAVAQRRRYIQTALPIGRTFWA